MIIHFIGIGGIGISALAQFCTTRGDKITGSDISDTEVLSILKEQGTPIFIPQEAKNIPDNCDLVVYTEAVSADNPERVEAKKRNIPEKSYFEYLGDISHEYRTIAVCGTHGKTTTIGLIASGFKETDFDATVFVGSTLSEFDGMNFYAGSNKWLLVEACEYRNNFQYLKPEVVVLTNVELDHTDFYKSEEKYFDTFRDFCEKSNVVICHNDDQNVDRLFEKIENEGLKLSDFDVETHCNVSLQIFGKHNRENAQLAIKLARLLELDLEKFKQGLQNYKGAGRRQEFLGEWNGIQVFSDYGHHPTEITATLQSFGEQFPNKKISLIYEPHQYSRTRQFFDEFCEALSGADVVGIFPIYAARDTDADKASVNENDLIKKIPHSQKVETMEDAQKFTSKLNEGDVLLFMGAGVVDGFAREFVNIKNGRPK